MLGVLERRERRLQRGPRRVRRRASSRSPCGRRPPPARTSRSGRSASSPRPWPESGSWPSWMARVSKCTCDPGMRISAPRKAASVGERLVEPRRVAPRAEQLERAASSGRSAARPARRAGRRRAAAARSSRTRASPAARTSRAGSGSPNSASARSRSWISRSNGERSDDAVGHRPVGRVRMRLPLALREPHAERAEALLGEDRARPRAASTVSVSADTSALGEIPQPLRRRAARRPRPRRRRWSDLEHQPDLRGAAPAVRRAARRRSGPRARATSSGPSLLELAQHVAAERARSRCRNSWHPPLVRVVRGERRSRASAPARAAGDSIGQMNAFHSKSAARPRAAGRARRGRSAPEPAPEDEVLRRRDRRDRVDLQEAERVARCRGRRRGCRRASCARTAIRRASSTLTFTGFVFTWTPTLQPDRTRQPVERLVERVVERRRRAHAVLAVEGLDDERAAARSDLRSTRPAIRSPRRNGST